LISKTKAMSLLTNKYKGISWILMEKTQSGKEHMNVVWFSDWLKLRQISCCCFCSATKLFLF